MGHIAEVCRALPTVVAAAASERVERALERALKLIADAEATAAATTTTTATATEFVAAICHATNNDAIGSKSTVSCTTI